MIEALDDVAVQVHQYDAEAGPHRRRHVQRRDALGHATTGSGSGFYQTRPRWGMANNYFAEKAGGPLPETYFHLGGGGFGGPIARNRTFFWCSVEGYGSNTTRNARDPAAYRSRESRRLLADDSTPPASLHVIYDPLTGDASGNGRTAVRRQHHSAEPPEPGGGEDAELPADSDSATSATARQLRQHARKSTTAR